jgi:hypothetical protein
LVQRLCKRLQRFAQCADFFAQQGDFLLKHLFSFALC